MKRKELIELLKHAQSEEDRKREGLALQVRELRERTTYLEEAIKSLRDDRAKREHPAAQNIPLNPSEWYSKNPALVKNRLRKVQFCRVGSQTPLQFWALQAHLSVLNDLNVPYFVTELNKATSGNPVSLITLAPWYTYEDAENIGTITKAVNKVAAGNVYADVTYID